MQFSNLRRSNYRKNLGFTLIELIVVIILISIMSVTVLPKFFTSNGFEEFTYRDELITKLRAIQLRSMQQTNDTTCHQIHMQTNPFIIGLQDTVPDINAVERCRTSNLDRPDLCYTSDNKTICYAGETTRVEIDSKHSVSFTLSQDLTSFSFSSLGRPEAPGCGDENTLCELILTVEGESTLRIEINREGYIHAI
jgi:MSHA pilin protein MshC